MTDWELRRRGIGASECAAVSTTATEILDPYRSRFDVWRSKVEGVETANNKHTWRGIIGEPGLLSWLERETGQFLSTHRTYQHPKHPIAFATPDGLCADWVAEVKMPFDSTWSQWGEPGSAEIPIQYYCQVQWQMGVCERRHAKVVALLEEPTVYEVSWHEEVWLGLLANAERFWLDYVVTKSPPPPDGSRETSAWIKRTYTKTNGVYALATAQQEEVITRYRAATAEVRRAERVLEQAKQEILLAIGPHDGLEAIQGRLTYRLTHPKPRTNWEQVARAAGATEAQIQAATVDATPYRTLRTPTNWKLEDK